MTDESGFSRPTSVADLLARLDTFMSPAGQELLADFEPEPSDVFVVTPAKCGTTWMQQIVHGLRSEGSMDFDNINDVVPWLGMSHVATDPARATQQGLRPHAFKSHSPLDEVPEGARYIVVLRDSADAMLSHYRFFAGTFFDAGSIDLETFAREYYGSGREVHEHVVAAWPRRNDADVRVFCYEAMKNDLPGTVASVAEFLDIPLDDDLRDLVVRQAQLDFMKQHESKFDDTALFESMRHRMRLPPTSTLSKVAPDGADGRRLHVSEGLRGEFEAAWRVDVTPSTGLVSYAELRAEI